MISVENKMADIIDVLVNFCQSYRNEILKFFNNSYSYFKDLYSYRSINIKIKFDSKNDQIVKETIKSLISSTNSALNTIGVPQKDLIPENELFIKFYKYEKENYKDFPTFFEKGLKPYINKYLFQIIIEYITGINLSKITNLDLFDLLPHKFMSKLEDFNNKYKNSFTNKIQLNNLIKKIDYYFNISDLSINKERIQELDEVEIVASDEDIIKQLQEARQKNIEFLESKPIKGKTQIYNCFLDYFGQAPRLPQGIIEMINVNRFNFMNSGLNNLEYFDLENLFYYVSILKMLGLESPLNMKNIKEILQDSISGKVFSSAKFHKPNPLSNFYGLCILIELGMINNTELIDMLDIEMYLEKELKNYIPKNVFLNLFSILSLNLLEKSGGVISDKKHLIKPLLNVDLTNLEDYRAPLDVFCYLSLLKIIDKKINFNDLKTNFISELGKCITKNGSINDNITDSARVLLIIHLLDSQKQEQSIVDNLFKYITKTVNFFSDNEINKDFNWDNDQLAYKVELRMLYWTLIALAQYFS